MGAGGDRTVGAELAMEVTPDVVSIGDLAPAGLPPSRWRHRLPETDIVVIGPESGFAEDELPVDARLWDLGPTILRVETAAVVAVAKLTTPDCSPIRGAGSYDGQPNWERNPLVEDFNYTLGQRLRAPRRHRGWSLGDVESNTTENSKLSGWSV